MECRKLHARLDCGLRVSISFEKQSTGMERDLLRVQLEVSDGQDRFGGGVGLVETDDNLIFLQITVTT